jgi:hypothetical protein
VRAASEITMSIIRLIVRYMIQGLRPLTA